VLPQNEVTRDDVFIDFGCGMGRVLLEAARYPFRRVVGVDIAPAFIEVARAVVARNRERLACSDVELVAADVLDYEVPDDVTVAYFADPFEQQILDTVAHKLLASLQRRPRRLRVIYFDPAGVRRLDGVRGARLVRYGRRRLRRWARAPYLMLYEIGP
jgi:SAM-dependent methyltransferase